LVACWAWRHLQVAGYETTFRQLEWPFPSSPSDETCMARSDERSIREHMQMQPETGFRGRAIVLLNGPSAAGFDVAVLVRRQRSDTGQVAVHLREATRAPTASDVRRPLEPCDGDHSAAATLGLASDIEVWLFDCKHCENPPSNSQRLGKVAGCGCIDFKSPTLSGDARHRSAEQEAEPVELDQTRRQAGLALSGLAYDPVEGERPPSFTLDAYVAGLGERNATIHVVLQDTQLLQATNEFTDKVMETECKLTFVRIRHREDLGLFASFVNSSNGGKQTVLTKRRLPTSPAGDGSFT
jgi:hypothetical protein